jgi:hypothetical protein
VEETGDDRDLNIYLVRSENGGANWIGPVQVNGGTSGVTCDQFMPAISVDTSGRVHMLWYDTRHDPRPSSDEDFSVHAYYRRGAFDQGGNFSLSDEYDLGLAVQSEWLAGTTYENGHVASHYFGDYLGITSPNNLVVPVYIRAASEAEYDDPSPIEFDDSVWYRLITY